MSEGELGQAILKLRAAREDLDPIHGHVAAMLAINERVGALVREAGGDIIYARIEPGMLNLVHLINEVQSATIAIQADIQHYIEVLPPQ